MVEWIVSSSVLIAVVILLRFVLKGRINLRLQYALWALVLARLLVPVSFGDTALSVGNLTQKAATSEPAQIVSALSEIELPKMSYQAAYNEVAKEYADRGIKIEDMPLEEYAETVDYEIMNKMNGDLSIAEVVKIVWFCGIALVGVWFVISNLRLLHSLKKNRTLLSSDHALPVYLSDAIDTPCLFGLFHPAIYLTSEAIESEHTQRHAVEHELTHFHHKDNIWAILRSVCLAVHWYNPLVWYAAVLSRNDAELACDESTILRLGEEERASYGRTLIHLTCEKRPALLNTATTMTGSGKSIKERIALIVKKPKMALYTVIAVVVIAAVAVGCTFTGAKDQPASFEEWTSSLTGEAIEWAETAKGYGVEEISYTVPESEFDDLSALLATITDENCSRKKPEAANEAGYRLALYRDDKLWLFKCLADGTIGLMFNDAETGAYYGSEGKLLIIEHPELWNYIVDTVDEKGIADVPTFFILCPPVQPPVLRSGNGRCRGIVYDKPFTLDNQMAVIWAIDDIGKAGIVALSQNKVIDLTAICITRRLTISIGPMLVFQSICPLPESVQLFSIDRPFLKLARKDVRNINFRNIASDVRRIRPTTTVIRSRS